MPPGTGAERDLRIARSTYEGQRAGRTYGFLEYQLALGGRDCRSAGQVRPTYGQVRAPGASEHRAVARTARRMPFSAGQGGHLTPRKRVGERPAPHTYLIGLAWPESFPRPGEAQMVHGSPGASAATRKDPPASFFFFLSPPSSFSLFVFLRSGFIPEATGWGHRSRVGDSHHVHSTDDPVGGNGSAQANAKNWG